jgi:hypothetical protein
MLGLRIQTVETNARVKAAKPISGRLYFGCDRQGIPTEFAPTHSNTSSRLSWLSAGANSAERLRRHIAKFERTPAGQKLWTDAEIKHFYLLYPDYGKARAVLPDRSLHAIKSKAIRSRTTRSRLFWSADDLKHVKAPSGTTHA